MAMRTLMTDYDVKVIDGFGERWAKGMSITYNGEPAESIRDESQFPAGVGRKMITVEIEEMEDAKWNLIKELKQKELTFRDGQIRPCSGLSPSKRPRHGYIYYRRRRIR